MFVESGTGVSSRVFCAFYLSTRYVIEDFPAYNYSYIATRPVIATNILVSTVQVPVAST